MISKEMTNFIINIILPFQEKHKIEWHFACRLLFDEICYLTFYNWLLSFIISSQLFYEKLNGVYTEEKFLDLINNKFVIHELILAKKIIQE